MNEDLEKKEKEIERIESEFLILLHCYRDFLIPINLRSEPWLLKRVVRPQLNLSSAVGRNTNGSFPLHDHGPTT